MFSITGVPDKLIRAITLVTAMLVVVGGAFWYVASKNTKIEKLTKDNAVKGVVVEQQADAIVKDAQSDKVNEEVNLKVTTKINQLRIKHEKVSNKTKAKVDDIKQEYGDSPPTPESEAEKANRISAARIDGLWESYCDKLPQADGCAAIHKPKVQGAPT